MSYGHGPELGAGGAGPGRSETGKRGHTARRAAFEHEVDPDGTLPPEEVARLVSERLSAISRRAVATNRARKAAAGLVDPAAAAEATYGHPPESAAEPEPLSPARRPEVADVMPGLLAQADVLAALADRDITTLYRALQSAGISQRQIAERTEQQQSSVTLIVGGRRVHDVFLLERIADGLGIERALMRLAGAAVPDAYSGEVTDTALPDEVEDEMMRRHLLALGPVAAFGAQIEGLGALLDYLPVMAAPPSRLSMAEVLRVRDLTRRLGEAGAGVTCAPEVISVAAAWATSLLEVSGPELTKRALMVAVAELHIDAGWAGFDTGLYRRAMYHYARALEVATEAGDAYLKALALNYAGVATVERGHPDDGLKMMQFGQVVAWDIPHGEPRAVVVGEPPAAAEAQILANCAVARVDLGDWDGAETDLARARKLWTPNGDTFGDLDRPAARLELARGRLDVAERFAAASARRWEGGAITHRALSGIVVATIHIQAGEPRGLTMAKSSIDTVAQLHSARARQRLLPLAEALESHSGDGRELARIARKVAA